MALKFNCPECNCELVVKFLKPGETAKCYDCGFFVTVPDDAEPNDSESSVLKSAKTRPYIESQTDSYTVIPRFGDALSYSWQVIKKNYDLSIGIAVVVFVGGVANGLANTFIHEKLGEGVIQIIMAQLLFSVISLILRTGVLKIALGFAFAQSAKPVDFKATFKQYLRCFFGWIIYLLMIILGLIVFIVPGIILAVRYQFFEFFILRYNLGIFESFNQSEILTERYRGKLFGFNIAATLFALSGLLACCIGIYITAPIAIVTWTYVFTRLIKEKEFDKGEAFEYEYDQVEKREIGEIKKPQAYPTIWQAITLMTMYAVLQIMAFIPVGLIEEITELPLMGFTPLEIALSIIVLGLITLFLMKKTGRSLKNLASLKNFNLWLLLPITLTFVGIGITASEIDNILRLFWPVAEWYKEFLEQLRSSLIGYIALAIIFAPVAEEFLFRGVIVRGFARNYSFKTAVLVSALLFGLVHLNPWQFVSAFYGGIILAWLFIETKSIIPCIYAHALYNGLDLILYDIFHFEIPGFTVSDSDKVLFQPWWFDLTGIILIAVGIWWLYNLFKRKKSAIVQVEEQDIRGF